MITSEKEASTRTAVIAGGIDTLITLGAVIAAQSSVLVADFLKTALEFVAVFLAWLAIRRITRGADTQFEYGLEKLENISSLVVGTMMVVVFLIIVGNAIRSIVYPGHIVGIGVWISLAAQIVYGVINGRLFLQNRRMAKKGNSPLVESQARLFFTKTFGNLFIFMSLSASLMLHDYSWSVYIDPIASLIIAGTILLAAIGIFTSSFYDLLDRTLEEADQMVILRELTKQFDQYDEMHGIRSRRAGGKEFIEVFLGYDPERTVRDVQFCMSKIKAAVKQQFPDSSVMIVLANEDIVAEQR